MIIALAAVLFIAPHAPAQEAVAPQVFAGARIQEIYRVRLDRGDLLLETIQDTIRRNNIQDGAVLTAAGSLSKRTYHRVKSLGTQGEQGWGSDPSGEVGCKLPLRRVSQHQRIALCAIARSQTWRTPHASEQPAERSAPRLG